MAKVIRQRFWQAIIAWQITKLPYKLHTIKSTLCLKKRHIWYCPYLCRLLTDFQNSFTGTLFIQLAIKQLLSFLPHFNYVTTLPCKTQIVKNH